MHSWYTHIRLILFLLNLKAHSYFFTKLNVKEKLFCHNNVDKLIYIKLSQEPIILRKNSCMQEWHQRVTSLITDNLEKFADVYCHDCFSETKELIIKCVWILTHPKYYREVAPQHGWYIFYLTTTKWHIPLTIAACHITFMVFILCKPKPWR